MQTDSRPEKRLQTLANLYNVVYDADSKFAVLLESLGYAKKAGLADLLLPAVRAHSEDWVADLALGPAAERTLYAAAADMLGGVVRKPRTAAREAYRLLGRLVGSYEGAAGAELAAAKPAAAQVVAEFLKSPDLFTFDLADSPAVAQLAADPQHAALHHMLTTLLSGSVKQFLSFTAAQGPLLEQLGISQEEALTKMRLLALMGLAHGASELPFADLQVWERGEEGKKRGDGSGGGRGGEGEGELGQGPRRGPACLPGGAPACGVAVLMRRARLAWSLRTACCCICPFVVLMSPLGRPWGVVSPALCPFALHNCRLACPRLLATARPAA